MSRTRLNGSSNGTPFHRSTITSELVPMPKDARPGAAAASDAARLRHQRRRAGEGGQDRRARHASDGSQAEASTSGVRPS